MSQALSDVSVLDLTTTAAGSYCTMLLADLGAEVVKVESPGGDPMRKKGPSFKGVYPVFTAYNRGKKSITVDIDDNGDVTRLKRIITHFDIIIEDRMDESLKRAGLDYEGVKDIHPNVIYADLTGYGRGNSYEKRPVFESVFQAESGMSFSILDDSKGTPFLIGGGLAGTAGAYFTLIPVLSALHQRLKEGKGQYVEVNTYYALLSMMHFNILDYKYNGVLYPGHGGGSPCGFVRTKDGIVRVTCSVKAMWDRTRDLLNDPVMNDPRFDDPRQREIEEPLLLERIESNLLNMTCKEVEDLFTKEGITIGIVRTIENIKKDPHMKEREQIVKIEVPGIGELPYFASPFRLSASKPKYRPAPLIGEHDGEFFSENKSRGGIS